MKKILDAGAAALALVALCVAVFSFGSDAEPPRMADHGEAIGPRLDVANERLAAR